MQDFLCSRIDSIWNKTYQNPTYHAQGPSENIHSFQVMSKRVNTTFALIREAAKTLKGMREWPLVPTESSLARPIWALSGVISCIDDS